MKTFKCSFPIDFAFNMSYDAQSVQHSQKQYFLFVQFMSIGCSERTTQPETIFFVFLYAKIQLLLVFLLSFSVVVLLPFSMIFKFNFGLNFNIIRFYLNCKISFGFLPIKQKSLGLLELASKMQEIWPCIEKVMVK